MARRKRRSAQRSAKKSSPPPAGTPAAIPGHASRRRSLILGAAGIAVVGGALYLFGRGGDGKPAPVAHKPVAAVDAAVARDAHKATIDANTAQPATYVGSAKCAECHDKEHAAWSKSWHAKALAPGKKPFVVGDYENRHFAGTSSEAWMKHAGDAFTMRAHGPDGALADYGVEWVIGGKRMQDAVTVFPDGRWQVLPVYFHVADKSWVDYTEAKQGALTPEHPFYWTNSRRMANHECLDCHTTALRVEYDDKARHWNTTFVDGSVACEDCHGAGSRHADTQEAADIVHPVHAGEVGLAACARCHGPRKPLFPLLDPERQFRLGDSYDELYDPIVVTMSDGMSPEFFADGKPKTSSFEYQAMLQAACYRRGKATCLTCHAAPHDAKGKSELRVADPDATCTKCHGAIAAKRGEHSHHKAATAQSCVACHMPGVVSGVLDHFADHALDVPSPQNTVKHGVPNACGLCHQDKTSEQLATSLAGWWPDAHVRQARRERLADAFDETTAKQSAKPLVQVITDDNEAPTLRGAAAIVLGRRFGPATARVLVTLLDKPDVILRAKGVEALAAAKAKGAVDAIARHVDDSSLRVRLAAALALHDLGDPRGDEALKKLASDPVSSHLMIPHLELGTALARRGNFADAQQELEQVAKLAPYFIDPLVELAAVEAEQGKFDEARARVAQALALEPKHEGALHLQQQIDARVPK